MQDVHEKWMREAIIEAKKAFNADEVPIGCVIVNKDVIIGRGYNQTETKHDPTAHAEILAIKKAARKLKSWRLDSCDVYVTVKPCAMCIGALYRARIKGLYYGAIDPEAACGKKPNKKVQIKGGILDAESKQLLRSFFKRLRQG